MATFCGRIKGVNLLSDFIHEHAVILHLLILLEEGHSLSYILLKEEYKPMCGDLCHYERELRLLPMIQNFFRLRHVFQKLLGGTSIMLFYTVLPDKKLTITPNKRNIVCSPCLSPQVILSSLVYVYF